MIRGMLAITLATFFVLQPAMNARAEGAQAANENPRTSAIRQEVEAAGPGSQVEVTLLDKNKLRGLLMSVGSEDFVVKSGEDQAAVVHKVRFEDVASVRVANSTPAPAAARKRSKLSRRGKIMLVVGFTALIFEVITFATTKGP